MELEKAYEILEIKNKNIDISELKKIYRNLSKKYHPDLYSNNPLLELANKKFKEIKEAYETLKESLTKVEVFTEKDFVIAVDHLGITSYFDKKTMKLIDGKIKIKNIFDGYTEGIVKDGCLNGIMYMYNREGFLLIEKTFVNGILEGNVIRYSKDWNGKSFLKSIINYKKGIQNGVKKYFTVDNSNERILQLEQEMLHGKVVKEKIYNDKGNLESEKKYDEKIIGYEIEEELYDEGYASGVIKIKYLEYEEICELKNGKIDGLSDIIYLNGAIKKKNYRNEKENSRFYIPLNKYNECLLKGLTYKKDNKIELIRMNSEEYEFYMRLIDLRSNLQKKLVEGLVAEDYKKFLKNFFKNMEKYMFSLLDSSSLREIDYQEAQKNINSEDLIEELKPNSLEDFAKKLRELKMFYKFYELEKVIERKSLRIENQFKKMTMMSEIKEKIYDIYFYSFGFNENTLRREKTPKILDISYIIELFKEEIKNGLIKNNTIKIMNMFFWKYEEIIFLLNFYIALKYDMDYMLMYKKLNGIALDNENQELYVKVGSSKIIKEIYGLNLTTLSEFLILIKLLVEDNIELDEIKIDGEKIIKFEESISRVKNEKNILYILYNKANKDKVNKILEKLETLKFEFEKQEEEKQEKLLINFYEKLEESSLKKLKENILEYDSEIIEELNFLLKDIKKEKIAETKIYNEVVKIIKDKKNYYLDKREKLNKEKDELTNKKINNDVSIKKCLIFSLFVVIIIIKKYNYLIGILLSAPVFTIFKKFFENSKENKQRELNYMYKRVLEEKKKIEEILDKIEIFLKF